MSDKRPKQTAAEFASPGDAWQESMRGDLMLLYVESVVGKQSIKDRRKFVAACADCARISAGDIKAVDPRVSDGLLLAIKWSDFAHDDVSAVQDAIRHINEFISENNDVCARCGPNSEASRASRSASCVVSVLREILWSGTKSTRRTGGACCLGWHPYNDEEAKMSHLRRCAAAVRNHYRIAPTPIGGVGN